MSTSFYVEEITAGIGAHGTWKMKLKTAITTASSDFKPSVVRCDDQCALGKWLHGSKIDAQTKLGMPYKVNKRVHAEFHECAARVLELALAGKAKDAQALLDGEFKERSEKVVRALNKWKGELLSSTKAA
ncbi:hypothetical protein DEM27_21385 [Metarhizobium album]|uniref:Chemoreceptor zinc-binding domain-containing protein n=1 Tax=Metarhizobium album TaxID=2182425 RepID=A0A2U2DLT9_9HYPH|nr:CZB domain-containing protein [Rhizobium album]PWE54259.1 hypothetical protein DEM27_21385 [Rhizobium album]